MTGATEPAADEAVHVRRGVAQDASRADVARAVEGATTQTADEAVLVARADESRPAGKARAVAASAVTVPEPAGGGVAAHVELTVRRFVAQALNLPAAEIQARKKFSEYGVDSIVGVELIDRLNQTLGAGLKVTALFDHGSVAALTAHVVQVYGRQIAARRGASKPQSSSIFETAKAAPTRKIAITGMSGRFPGAADVRQFWENLAAGRSAIGASGRGGWDAGLRGGYLSGIDEFDPLFFQMSGVEAQHTDPQQRLFLEECWKAFEDAGYSDRWLNRKKCGVFAGVTAGDYAQNMSEPSPYAFLGNGVSILASRIAYLLNLKGPALAVDTACSSSLVALHLACQSILNGECEMALAGGVFLTTTPTFHQMTGSLGMLSPTGTCSAFDDRADGFVPGEGVGVVVLRPLEDAVRDGDHIYGVILGTGTNQDGNTNGITAPSSQSQTELAVEVYRRASVDPSTISYVEAHGTGTKLGDPVEIEGLKQAFAQFTDRCGFCAIGSVKTNIGHAGPAAGVAGLIKVLLAMEHRELPASLNFETPNRHIEFAETPFFVNRAARAWDGPRRAAVSAFGLSGTNAHVVVEEAPPRTAAVAEGGSHVVALSGKTPEALAARVSELAEWLERDGGRHRLADIAFTLNAGRSHFEHRAAFVVRDAAELVRALRGERASGSSEVADAYLAGKEIDWQAVYRGRERRRVPLPVYPFRRERYWVGERQRESAGVSYFRKSWRPLQKHGGAIAAAGILAIDETAERARALDPAIRWVRPGGAIGDDARVVICFAQSAIWALAAEASRRAIDAIVVYQPQGSVQDCVWEASAGIAPSLAALRPGARWTTVRASDSANVAGAVRTLLGRAGKWPAELRCEGGAILEPVWEEAKLPAQKRGLRRGGVYWIAGGSGALGRMLARYLTREYDARVILTSRRAVEVSGSVECMPGDVADAARMREIAARIRARHGAIHGVFHAAGTIAPEVVGQKSAAQIEAVLAPKVRGAIALDEATREDALDFFCLFSSISAVVGDFGQCDYAAANRFLDAFAEHRTGRGRTVSIGWPLWADGGMRLSGAELDGYVARSGMALLGEAEGFAALERCLAGSERHVLVVTADPTRAAGLLPSPSVGADHVGHIRSTIASMLRLDPRDLGADVCLNAFGLDSLNMKDLATRLSGDFQVELSPTALFEHNSIAALAAHLAKQERAVAAVAPVAGRRTEAVAMVGTPRPEVAPRTEPIAIFGMPAPEVAPGTGPIPLFGMPGPEVAPRAESIAIFGASAPPGAHGTEPVAIVGTPAPEVAPRTEPVSIFGTPAGSVTPRTGPIPLFGMPGPGVAPRTEPMANSATPGPEVASGTGPVAMVGTHAPAVAPGPEPMANSATPGPEVAPGTEPIANVATLGPEVAPRTGPIPTIGTPAPRTEAIAIIGASGRFPQSRDLEEFWRNLIAGRDLISEIPAERWDWRDYQTAGVDGKPVSRWGGFMPEIDRFDAAFFGISPREAGLMDPQHRLFLETAWKTLEDAGQRPSSLAGRKVGVFVGAQLNEYMQLIGDAGEAKAQAALGNTHTMLANRVSYWFDFRGPSETVDTACSSALVAVHRAVRAIQGGDCEMAIAGGVSAILSPDTYVLASHLGMLSPDGRCKTFDRTANGYVKGEGVGAVLLKPLSRARADGDNVRAVILSTAENHGGRANFLTAPNPEAQAALLKSAYGGAGIDPRTVSYVEAHGTGTELGDPIEVDALKRAFRELADESGQALPDRPFCGLGTVKSSVGHLEPAAGIAGLLKVVLALQARRLPPTLHVRDVNPYLKLDGSPFYLVTSAREWESAGPRRAGVSAFGFGGSNAHVVLEEYRAAPAVEGGGVYAVPFSARTEERLRALVESFCAFLRESPGVSWRDLVYTMQAGREPMKERLTVEASGPAELLAKLTRWLSDGVSSSGEWTAAPGRRVSLPTYPFARDRHWCDGQRAAAPRVVVAEAPAVVKGPVVETLRQMLAALLYLDPALVENDATFTDLGLDSILAVELVKKINDAFGTDIRATRLYDYCNLGDLARHVGECAGVAPVADGGGVKAVVTELLADALYLDPSKVDEEASFSELGLDSILAVELVKKINERLGVELRATRLYDFPNVRELAAFLAGAGGGSVRGGGGRAEADGPSARLQKFASAEGRAEARRRMNPAPHGADSSLLGTSVPPVWGPLHVSTSARALARLVAGVLSLREQDVDEDTPLMELGLDLVSAAELAKALREEYGSTIAAKDLLSIGGLRQLEARLGSAPPVAVASVAADDIAIIGMSGRFPGAANLAEFWANLAAGVDSVADVPAERWPIDRYYDPTPGAPLKTYCRRGGFLKDIDQFDPLFFQISPQEAEWMDPQQRLFLEESWLALEDAGYPDSRLSRTNCAVFVGVSQGDYFQLVDTTSAAASQFSLGNVNSILASRIAYFLNLKGPAVALDTACSSSLVAIHLACQSLRSGECEMALAGGVSVMTTPHMHLLGSQGRMLSADGKCKAFDAAADGFVPAEGVGAVVLKRLDAAMRDGDRIHATIRGAGVNQDGKTNGITAPSAQSQAALESAVYERFGLDPATFGYVEAHGTGTALGDPIELDALTESFRRHTSEKAFCAIGSVKTNIGHSLPASGMAGLLKTVLALQHGQIPPTLHCETENGQIDFASSPFYVNRELTVWRPRAGAPRRAAISSFGFSGTNAHVVVEEAPRAGAVAVEEARALVFCLSAKTPEALRRTVAGLEAWLVADGGRSRLGDLSYTLCARRSAFRHRVAVVVSTREELLAALRDRPLPDGRGSVRGIGPKTVSGGRLEDLAAAWMRGETVDWAAEFDASQRRVLSLPGYPFVRRRCWAKAAVASAADPWIDECRPGFAAAQARKRFGVEDELLRDHRVQGQAVLPGVAYLEMARAAIGRVETGRRVAEIRNLVWKAPFRVGELTVRMRPSGSSVAFDFASDEAHAQGEAVFGEAAAPARRDLARLMAACPREFAGGAVYEAFARMGIEYGPSFRCLEWVRAGERDAVGRIVAPASGGYAIHPGALDAALQTMIGFALGDGGPREPMLPFALERYCVHGAIEGACFAHASVRGEVFDVHVLDGEGNVLVALEGFTARRAKTDSGRLALFAPVWRLAPPAIAGASRTGATLIFRGPEDFGLTAALTRVHAGSPVTVAPIGAEAALDVSRIYFLGGLCSRPLLRPEEVDDFQESSVVALFRLAKALIAGSARPELIVVSNNVQRVLDADAVFPQAGPLAGFARVLAAEYPELRARMIDVSAADLTGADDSVAQALAGDDQDEIALRRGKRFRRTLEAVTPEGAGELPLRERGVYIILGGMGGLGLTFARHLASTRRARLVLVGRSSLSREKQQALHDLDALGGDAIYHAADITDAAQMAEVRAGAMAKWGAVHGVIDSAFVLRDMSLANMDEARLREALDPKVRGTAAALWTFRGDKLDWFALFSSSISFTAGAGQANYAAASTGQDALGNCWNAEGAWPVRILNWGYWGSVGAVASDVYRRRAAALGVGSIEEADGIAAFHAALAGAHTQLLVAKTVGVAAAKREAAPVDEVAAQDAVAYVRRVVSEVLQLTADDLDDERPFEEYGVDSLVSLTIVTQLEADLGPLAKTLLFEHPTIARLGRYVATRRGPAAPAVLFPIRETGSRPLTFWVHSVVGEMNWAVRLAHHMGPEWPVFGFKAAALEVERPAYSRLEEMAAAYVKAMRAAQPAGPYILGGFSFGGSVAFEMARQLGEAGERVSWLVLLDAYAPGSRALDSLARMSWDGFLPQVIANLLVHQWKGTEFLAADALPKGDFEAQIKIAARHVRAACAIPQSEADIARIMKNSARAADFHAELQQNYVARPCPAVERAILVRNRYGFVGPDNALGLPRTAVDDAAPDHGWSQWLSRPPLIVEADADHFSLGLEPAIEVVGRRIAQLIGERDASAAQQRVFDVVKEHVLRVLPDLRAEAITLDARLKDLGANSLDRIEVATCAMEELDINVPRTRLAGVDSLGGLVDALLGSLPGNGKG
jgi:acyl transferase domain-containing protein/thioesterase domain-containing protein